MSAQMQKLYEQFRDLREAIVAQAAGLQPPARVKLQFALEYLDVVYSQTEMAFAISASVTEQIAAKTAAIEAGAPTPVAPSPVAAPPPAGEGSDVVPFPVQIPGGAT